MPCLKTKQEYPHATQLQHIKTSCPHISLAKTYTLVLNAFNSMQDSSCSTKHSHIKTYHTTTDSNPTRQTWLLSSSFITTRLPLSRTPSTHKGIVFYSHDKSLTSKGIFQVSKCVDYIIGGLSVCSRAISKL